MSDSSLPLPTTSPPGSVASASPVSAGRKNWQRLRQDPRLWSQFLVRGQVMQGIRDFFSSRGFEEVETPLLVEHPGTEPFLEVFATELQQANGRRQPAYLLTSPEYAMKKLLVAGLPRVYQVSKSFRNGEGESSRHNPEFTILEWYRTPGSYQDIMTDCEQLLPYLAGRVAQWRLDFVPPGVNQSGGEGRVPGLSLPRPAEPSLAHQTGQRAVTSASSLTYQGKTYDLTAPWERLSVAEAFARYAHINTEQLLDETALKAVAEQKGYQVTPATTWEEVYNQILLNEIEPHLGQTKPTILYDYPVSQAALAQPKASDPRFAERFELYLAGLELGNAFSELTDAAEQERRFRAELAERARLGKTVYQLDHDYLAALQTGLPPTGGIAVGVDRLVMLLADAARLQEVTFFPVADVFDAPA